MYELWKISRFELSPKSGNAARVQHLSANRQPPLQAVGITDSDEFLIYAVTRVSILQQTGRTFLAISKSDETPEQQMPRYSETIVLGGRRRNIAEIMPPIQPDHGNCLTVGNGDILVSEDTFDGIVANASDAEDGVEAVSSLTVPPPPKEDPSVRPH